MTRRVPTRARICFWVLATAAACSHCASCQDPLDYVPNLPYVAQFVQTYTSTEADGTRVQGKSIMVKMRDSQGRTRIETFPPGKPTCTNDSCAKPGVVNLYIPLRRQFIQLFPGRKTASVMTFPGTGPIPHQMEPNDKNIKRESLPGTTVHGIYAVGTRITQLRPADRGRKQNVVSVGEEWVSPDLKLVVLDKYKNTDPLGDDTVTEIQRLDRTEPDPALFEIPADYKIVSDEPQSDAQSKSPSARLTQHP